MTAHDICTSFLSIVSLIAAGFMVVILAPCLNEMFGRAADARADDTGLLGED